MMSRLLSRLAFPLLLTAGIPFLACQEPTVKSRSQPRKGVKESKMAMQIIPETIGASSAPFELGLAAGHMEFTVHPPSGPAAGVARRSFLRIENLTTETDAPSYDVYINVPRGSDPKNHPDLKVGYTPTFGLHEASRGDGVHPGDGLGTQIEVTALLNRLKTAGLWDGKSLRVSFVPESIWTTPAKLRVGRVSLIVG